MGDFFQLMAEWGWILQFVFWPVSGVKIQYFQFKAEVLFTDLDKG